MLAATRRLALLVVGCSVVTAALSALFGELIGASLDPAVSPGFFGLGRVLCGLRVVFCQPGAGRRVARPRGLAGLLRARLLPDGLRVLHRQPRAGAGEVRVSRLVDAPD